MVLCGCVNVCKRPLTANLGETHRFTLREGAAATLQRVEHWHEGLIQSHADYIPEFVGDLSIAGSRLSQWSLGVDGYR